MASDGGIFSFGDAAFYGSTGSIHLVQPIVAMAPTPDGKGYWMVAVRRRHLQLRRRRLPGSAAGGPGLDPAERVVSTASGHGYWVEEQNGTAYPFGDAVGAPPTEALMFTPATPGDKAVLFAFAQLGKPYIWGGNGPVGYDCSGLALAAWESVGVGFARVSDDQYHTAGQPVALNSLSAGDLVFWGTSQTDWTTVYHTAIYVGGDQIVEATGDHVQLNSLGQWGSGDLMPNGRRPRPTPGSLRHQERRSARVDVSTGLRPRPAGPAPRSPPPSSPARPGPPRCAHRGAVAAGRDVGRTPSRLSGVPTTRRSGTSGCGSGTSIPSAASCSSSTKSATERTGVHGTDRARNRAVPLRRGPLEEARLQKVVQRVPVGHPVGVLAVGRVRGEIGESQRVAEPGEQVVVRGSDHQVAVGRREDLVRRQEGRPTPVPLGLLPRAQVAGDEIGQPPGRRLVEADLDQAAHARLVPAAEGRLNPDRRPHGGAEVDGGDREPGGRAVRVPRQRHHAALGLEDRVVPGPVALRALGTRRR